MKRVWLILIGGLMVGLAAYASIYFTKTAPERSLNKAGAPALAWLQHEYHLSDAQFDRIRQLHESYQPRCMEMCRQIDEKNARLQELLSSTNTVTPEIEKALAEAAQTRAHCEAAMLEHFYQIAGAMPPEQGKRYLAWVQSETLTPGRMPSSEPPPSSSREP
jgi:Spy/CpxP family protein refolding chaperone